MLRNKKYGMGGAVQSFSSPMLAQGMQGGLSGFGTSGLGTFADGGQVRVVKKDEGNFWYRRTEGAIGSFAWRYDKNYNEGILFPLDKFYSDFYKNVKLKQGEVLFRYETDRMMGRMQPLIKFNLDKSLIYFGVDSDEDEPNFETKGIKAEYIVLEEGYDKKYAKGGRMSNVEMGRMKIKDWYKKNYKTDELGDELNPNTTFDDLFSAILNGDVYSAMGVHDSVVRERLFSKLSKIKGRYENYAYELYVKYGDKPLGSYAKGGEIIDQYEGRTPADIWFNLTKSQRRHLLLDHANIPSGELSSYIGDDTSFDELPHFVKQIVKKHFAEGQYAKGGQIASIGDSGIITDKNSMFVGKMALITGDLGNMYEVRVGERTTIVKKNGIRIISDEYAEGGKTRKSGNVPRISKKVAEVNALIEKGNQLGLEVVDSSSTWQSPMKYKPIKYVNGILYIEYEKLDLYALSKRGVQKWDIQKDKVLKRNMEFDNPLNDIAKMYRKALREREQYFSDGGDVDYSDRFNSARTRGRDSQNWEAELKEYAGEHYNSLTRQEREEIIADMQRGFDRNTHFAKGGKTSTYEVHLEAVPNIDYDQSDYRANVRVSKLKKSAKSIDEAVRIAKNFIEDNDLGGGNFIPAKLYKNGKQVGFISYNGRVWNNEQSEMKYAKGGQIKPKTSRITLIMDGQKYSYPVQIVNGQVQITEETFKDGVVREYLDKEFDLWLQQAPSDYEEMYYGDEDVMSKSGAIEGAMEIVISTIEEEAPKKMTFNFDEGDVEFYEAYQYARGGSIAVSDDKKKKSLKGNLKIKF